MPRESMGLARKHAVAPEPYVLWCLAFAKSRDSIPLIKPFGLGRYADAGRLSIEATDNSLLIRFMPACPGDSGPSGGFCCDGIMRSQDTDSVLFRLLLSVHPSKNPKNPANGENSTFWLSTKTSQNEAPANFPRGERHGLN